MIWNKLTGSASASKVKAVFCFAASRYEVWKAPPVGQAGKVPRKDKHSEIFREGSPEPFASFGDGRQRDSPVTTTSARRLQRG